MEYIDRVMNDLAAKDPGEAAFHQAAREVLNSIAPVLERNSRYERWGILERMVEPERQIAFRVPWVDDNNRIHVNRGYRVQFNNAIGPYKGGIRLHPSVNLDIMKFLGFEQCFKNALTGLPMGGAKGGADFNPKGRSEMEIMRFCQSFITTLYKHIGSHHDIPAGDIGTGEREIGYMFGQYKRMTSHFENTLTGKGLTYGGSYVRTEATGYGLVYLTEHILATHGRDFNGLKVVVSGSGNVAIFAAEKAQQLGATVIAMSDSTGYIHDPEGVDLAAVKEIKLKNYARLAEYPKYCKHAQYHEGRGVFGIPCDVALPCATQNELTEADAKTLAANGCLIVAEGANMPCTPGAIACFQANKMLYVPGKAANAGGVATSGLEMSQNALRYNWTFEKVDQKLREIMQGIFVQISQAAEDYGMKDNYLAGANIAGFVKVAEAMIAQGVC
ncbi:MAG: NADP-specific glutamate dehydrogenase [Clostridia bacterium]|nr:NADP-specific glutamate dehydrogenase [Clostridia bacterium]